MLRATTVALLASSLSLLASASPLQRRAKAPAFFLAGDSTTAVQSTGGGGWGDGFLDTTLKNGAWGTNYGHNGATTASFRSGGDWATVLAAVADAADDYDPYVTIQFGHNDQKSTSGVTIAQFQANLETFVDDVRAAGGTPILLTSLTRRSFSNGVLVDSLADVREATIAAAEESGAELAHLNERSAEYVQAIGEDDAHTYNLASDDNTHLNYEGSVVFGGLVAELLLENDSSRSTYIEVDSDLKEALDDGVYYWPDV
jgi:lysophospholipase L1-like esterase